MTYIRYAEHNNILIYNKILQYNTPIIDIIIIHFMTL